jgi:putative DNA-invertase from lambdoid prophage Rac
MATCALYHRTSTLDQNPALARDELRKAAAMRDLQVAMEVKGLVTHLLVWKLDRAGRSALDLLTNVEELNRCGVRFICTSQSIDIAPGGDPMSRLLLTMLSAVSEFERSLIRERTRLAIDQVRKRGGRLGRPPTMVMPSHAAVDKLRSQGLSWVKVATTLGCAATTARRVHLIGPGKSPVQVAELKGAP